jgi:hypothetical protein
MSAMGPKRSSSSWVVDVMRIGTSAEEPHRKEERPSEQHKEDGSCREDRKKPRVDRLAQESDDRARRKRGESDRQEHDKSEDPLHDERLEAPHRQALEEALGSTVELGDDDSISEREAREGPGPAHEARVRLEVCDRGRRAERREREDQPAERQQDAEHQQHDAVLSSLLDRQRSEATDHGVAATLRRTIAMKISSSGS